MSALLTTLIEYTERKFWEYNGNIALALSLEPFDQGVLLNPGVIKSPDPWILVTNCHNTIRWISPNLTFAHMRLLAL